MVQYSVSITHQLYIISDWAHVEGFNRNMTMNDSNVILPRVLRHLTPQVEMVLHIIRIKA